MTPKTLWTSLVNRNCCCCNGPLITKKRDSHACGLCRTNGCQVKKLPRPLNNDKKINRKDAAVLYDLIDQLSRQQGWIIGGLGEYEANHAHGPFVHVDSRGYRARWGKP